MEINGRPWWYRSTVSRLSVEGSSIELKDVSEERVASGPTLETNED